MGAPQNLSEVKAMNSQGSGIFPLSFSRLCGFSPHFPAPVLSVCWTAAQHWPDYFDKSSEWPWASCVNFGPFFFFFPWSCSSSCSVLRRSPYPSFCFSNHPHMCRVTSRAAESRNLGIELWIRPSEKVLVQGKNWVVCNNSPLILSQANPSWFHWNLVKTHIAEKGRGCNLKQEPRGCWKCGILSWQQLLLWAVGLFLITPSFYSSTASPKLFNPQPNCNFCHKAN